MRLISLFIIAILFQIKATAETPFLHSIIQEERGKVLHYTIIYQQDEKRTRQELTYYWYTNGKMHSTQGDFSGNLLHGNYTESTPSDHLIAKGHFVFGLKDGSWKYWNKQGEIEVTETWRKGFLIQKVHISSSNTITEQYKHNLLHRRKTVSEQDKTTTTAKYKKGVLKQPRLSFLSVLKTLTIHKKKNTAKSSKGNDSDTEK